MEEWELGEAKAATAVPRNRSPIQRRGQNTGAHGQELKVKPGSSLVRFFP